MGKLFFVECGVYLTYQFHLVDLSMVTSVHAFACDGSESIDRFRLIIFYSIQYRQFSSTSNKMFYSEIDVC